MICGLSQDDKNFNGSQIEVWDYNLKEDGMARKRAGYSLPDTFSRLYRDQYDAAASDRHASTRDDIFGMGDEEEKIATPFG
jgi:hypothetical protein